ncbi:MAG TPA: type II toxin-antitoxin system RelE/ParE family toxin [Pirellulaceae bacterium]|jgi:toxin ParE1/3/4
MRDLAKSSRAELDLLAIWEQLAVHGESVADNAIDLIEKRCTVIRQIPFGAEACPQFGEGMRWFPAGNYIIFYKVQDDCIHVVRVLDGRRDLPRVFWQGES